MSHLEKKNFHTFINPSHCSHGQRGLLRLVTDPDIDHVVLQRYRMQKWWKTSSKISKEGLKSQLICGRSMFHAGNPSKQYKNLQGKNLSFSEDSRILKTHTMLNKPQLVR